MGLVDETQADHQFAGLGGFAGGEGDERGLHLGAQGGVGGQGAEQEESKEAQRAGEEDHVGGLEPE